MNLSRKTRRSEDAVLPGDFQGFEPFQDGDPNLGGCLHGAIRHFGDRVELEEMALEWSSDRKPSFAILKSQAERLSRQVTYLDGRLEIVDQDRRGLTIQLRTLPPYQDDAQIQFNEVRIGRDRIELKRIAFSRRDEIKQQVPLNLPKTILARLMADLRQALAPA